MLDRWSDLTAKAMLAFPATLALFLSFLVVADVVGRTVFGAPVKGTPEIVSMSIVVICFLQASYAIRSGGMLRVDVFEALIPRRVREALLAAGCLLGIAFFGVIVYGGLDPLAHAWSSGEYEGEGALRVPSWPARFVVILGSALAALNYALAFVRHVRDVMEKPR